VAVTVEFVGAFGYARRVSRSPSRVREARLFPLPDIVLFPKMRLPLHVFEPRYRRLVSDALGDDKVIAVVRLKPGYERDYYGCPAIYDVCGMGRIVDHSRLPDGRFNIMVEGTHRARLLDELTSEPYRLSRALVLEDLESLNGAGAGALKRELGNLVRLLLPHLSPPTDTLERALNEASSAGECADALAATLVSDPDVRQELLEELDPVERMTRLIGRLHELLALAGASRHSEGELN